MSKKTTIKRNKSKKRIRKVVFGSKDKPRLSVFRSNKEIYAQIIDDVNSSTIVAASSVDKDLKLKTTNKIEISKIVADSIAKRLEFKNVVCTKCEQKNNTFTGRIQNPPSLGEGKLKNVQAWMKKNGFSDFKDTTFYSDSILDIPLLEKVEKPVAVNPDNDLYRVSQNLGWEIIVLPI